MENCKIILHFSGKIYILDVFDSKMLIVNKKFIFEKPWFWLIKARLHKPGEGLHRWINEGGDGQYFQANEDKGVSHKILVKQAKANMLWVRSNKSMLCRVKRNRKYARGIKVTENHTLGSKIAKTYAWEIRPKKCLGLIEWVGTRNHFLAF